VKELKEMELRRWWLLGSGSTTVTNLTNGALIGQQMEELIAMRIGLSSKRFNDRQPRGSSFHPSTHWMAGRKVEGIALLSNETLPKTVNRKTEENV
jgi:hypothetical protein